MVETVFLRAIVSVHLQFTNEIIYLVSGGETIVNKPSPAALRHWVVYEMNADDSLDLQQFEESAEP